MQNGSEIVEAINSNWKASLQKWTTILLQGMLVAVLLILLLYSITLYFVSVWAGYVAIRAGEFGIAGNIAAYASATATGLLIAITAVYAYSTHRSVRLSTQQLNREVRQRHTDTLRQRVSNWLGDYRTDSDLTSNGESNLPTVQRTTIEPAPPIVEVFERQQEFRIIPEALENDRYLEDFLQNHAREVQEKLNEIKDLQAAFEQRREQFLEAFDDTRAIEEVQFRASKGAYFEQWAFERIVLLERGFRDKEGLYKIIDDAIEKESMADNEFRKFPGDMRNIGPVIRVLREIDIQDEEVATAMKQTVDRLEQHEAYDTAAEAAELLDQLDDAVDRLKNDLIEYKGRPLYPGDCEYLTEASVQSESLFSSWA